MRHYRNISRVKNARRAIDPRLKGQKYVSGGRIGQTIRRLGNRYVLTPLKGLMQTLPKMMLDTATKAATDALVNKFTKSSGGALTAPDPHATAKIQRKIAAMQSKYGY
ncbi:MAG: hypothetical protein WDA28_12830 [Castellaniella sp.]